MDAVVVALPTPTNVVALEQPKTRRGTSNGNRRGSSEDRRRRKEWLVTTYRADRDLHPKVEELLLMPGEGYGMAERRWQMEGVPFGEGLPAARCYRCGKLLTVALMTVDRIVPECKGGTYRRTNIRPACSGCNSETGGALANGKEHQAAKSRARKKAPRRKS